MARVDSISRHTSLETSVEEARLSFACAFSSSEEFEAALIENRRAAGLYGPSSLQRQGAAMGIAVALLVVVCFIVL